MGTFQSGINNILGAVAGTTALVSGQIQKNKEIKAEELKAKKEAEDAEQADIKEANEKLADARMMAVGYSAQDIRKQKAEKTLGLENPLKMPRGVQKRAFDRRMANAIAMEEIHSKYAQNKEFRDKIRGLKSKDIAKAIKPEINKKGGTK